jgi:predicted RNA-binding Zn-ribbon protein involved in translation (DUF1610 family)
MNNYKYGCCPHCGGTRLGRKHRGFIRKYVLKTAPMFVCGHCAKVIFRDEIKYKLASQESAH